MQRVDLRSDFLTRPTAAMLRAMEIAAGDPADFGLREDPRQIALERRAAEILGKEDALLVPTCTMANEIALMLLARPGEAVATQRNAHIITSEAGAPAVLGGLLVQAVESDEARTFEGWERAARQAGDELKPRVAAFALENTHNRSGGRYLSAQETARICAIARAAGVRVHLDGSRLCNAAVAQACAPAELAMDCDTVALSLNKALGAPFGAVLAGSAELINKALTLRQRLGGGVRPTGMIAAAGLHALEDWSHLSDDHRRARDLASSIANIPGLHIARDDVMTNIVAVRITAPVLTPSTLCDRLAQRGVLALPFGEDRIRFVTYRDIDDEAISYAADAIRGCL